MGDPSRRGLFGLLAGVTVAPMVGWGAGGGSHLTTYTMEYGLDYAPMVFSGFQSTIPVGEIADIGVLIKASEWIHA